MVNRFLLGIFLLVFLLAGGCASRILAPEYSGAPLGDDEGLVAFYTHNPNERLKLFFKGRKHSFETPEVTKGSEAHLIRVPADDYELTALYVGAIKLNFTDFIRLKVRPGKMTYPGDIVMNGTTLNFQVLLDDFIKEFPKDFPLVDPEIPIIVGSEIIKNRRNAYEGLRSARRTKVD